MGGTQKTAYPTWAPVVLFTWEYGVKAGIMGVELHEVPNPLTFKKDCGVVVQLKDQEFYSRYRQMVKVLGIR